MMDRVIRNPSGYHSQGGNAAGKAAYFAEFIKTHGGGGSWSTEDGMLHLVANRGDNETIEIWWEETGKFIEAIYTLASETVGCHNVSAAAAIAAKAPSTERLRNAARTKRKEMGVIDKAQDASELIASAQGTLPFDHESTDKELKAVLFNRSITWVNRLSGALYSAVVGGKMFRVVNGDVPRQISFCDSYGYHAVYLDSIVSVEVSHRG